MEKYREEVKRKAGGHQKGMRSGVEATEREKGRNRLFVNREARLARRAEFRVPLQAVAFPRRIPAIIHRLTPTNSLSAQGISYYRF